MVQFCVKYEVPEMFHPEKKFTHGIICQPEEINGYIARIEEAKYNFLGIFYREVENEYDPDEFIPVYTVANK